MLKLLMMCLCVSIIFSCTLEVRSSQNVQGSWQLISGTTITGTDTVVTTFGGEHTMIKIINKDHFAFLRHDNNKGKDSTASFSAGGGRYTLSGDEYTEYLDYCNYRDWEGHVFPFNITLKGDTLVQSGIEKLEDQGINRKIIEKYVRVKTAKTEQPD